eukprot:1153329_1
MHEHDVVSINTLKDRFKQFVIRKLDKNMGTCIVSMDIWNKSVDYTLSNSNHFEHVPITQRISFFRNIKAARDKLDNDWQHIGKFIGLLKMHKDKHPNGTWKIRTVVSHKRSIIRPVSIANSILWRKMRYTIELSTKYITVLPHVTDLIFDLRDLNEKIANNVIELNHTKIVVVDMEKMYPSTKRSKIFHNLFIGESLAGYGFDNDEIPFMRKAQIFINKYSLFQCGDRIYRQPDGAIIGSSDGADVCDTVYYINECV